MGENKRRQNGYAISSIEVKRDIELKIITGQYIAGEKIPTIVELVEQYNIGKTTAQKVINDLHNEGIIVKKVGVGCFVKPFIREKLLFRHKKALEEELLQVAEAAILLGIDRKNIHELMEQAFDLAEQKSFV